MSPSRSSPGGLGHRSYWVCSRKPNACRPQHAPSLMFMQDDRTLAKPLSTVNSATLLECLVNGARSEHASTVLSLRRTRRGTDSYSDTSSVAFVQWPGKAAGPMSMTDNAVTSHRIGLYVECTDGKDTRASHRHEPFWHRAVTCQRLGLIRHSGACGWSSALPHGSAANAPKATWSVTTCPAARPLLPHRWKAKRGPSTRCPDSQMRDLAARFGAQR